MEPTTQQALKGDVDVLKTFRVLKHDGEDAWLEMGDVQARYRPDAQQIGDRYGAGEYLLIEHADDRTYWWAIPITVAARTTYYEPEPELEDEDE